MPERQLRERCSDISEDKRRVHLANMALLLNGRLEVSCIHRVQTYIVLLDGVVGVDLYGALTFLQCRGHVTAVKISQRQVCQPPVIGGGTPPRAASPPSSPLLLLCR